MSPRIDDCIEDTRLWHPNLPLLSCARMCERFGIALAGTFSHPDPAICASSTTCYSGNLKPQYHNNCFILLNYKNTKPSVITDKIWPHSFIINSSTNKTLKLKCNCEERRSNRMKNVDMENILKVQMKLKLQIWNWFIGSR